jgi:hypothetical protein
VAKKSKHFNSLVYRWNDDANIRTNGLEADELRARPEARVCPVLAVTLADFPAAAVTVLAPPADRPACALPPPQ